MPVLQRFADFLLFFALQTSQDIKVGFPWYLVKKAKTAYFILCTSRSVAIFMLKSRREMLDVLSKALLKAKAAMTGTNVVCSASITYAFTAPHIRELCQ